MMDFPKVVMTALMLVEKKVDLQGMKLVELMVLLLVGLMVDKLALN